MDDLAGLDWSKPAASQHRQVAPMNPSCPPMPPVPSPLGPGRTVPLSSQASAGLSSSKPAATKAAQDSFSNLVSFGPAKSTQSLTIAERQAQLEAEKRREEEERRRHCETQFGSGQQWDALASRSSAPSPSHDQTKAPPNGTAADDVDLLAAFDKDTQVDNASHYPPPNQSSSLMEKHGQLDLKDPNAWRSNTPPHAGHAFAPDDDDPFGLNDLKASVGPSASALIVADDDDDDDDFLGDLGRPVDEVRKKQQETARLAIGKPLDVHRSSSAEDQRRPQRGRKDRRPKENDDAFDLALAQLLDYGFSPDQARRGLMRCGGTADAEAAANWLLDEAHGQSRQQPQQARQSSTGPARASSRTDAWRTAERDEADLAKSAAAVGNSLFKTANSLWKTGQKKVQRAVADFQHEGDPSQPRWMWEAHQGHVQRLRETTSEQATDEALALEGGSWAKLSQTDGRQAREARVRADSSRASSSGSPSSVQGRSSPAPRWQHRTASPNMSDARSRLHRLAADDDTFSGHLRANRSRKDAALTEPKRTDMSEPDLLGSEAPKPTCPKPHRPAQRSVPSGAMRPRAAPTPPQARRRVPPMDAAALESSTKHRLEGTAHFKRGEFAMAHSSYSSSMSAVPASHPLMIVLLANRALAALKTGEPKQAVADVDEAVKLIGPGQGQGETVTVRRENGQEESRDMKELYGKALSRKAEALEQMERWADAGATWQLCVEAGLSGPTAIKGRQRCQDALRPKPKLTTPRAPRPGASAGANSSQAVVRLREAARAAAREDDEKFALADAVDAKVSAWRDGKRDNLRALLSSLDKVLWEKSGWRSVGMHELVMANKVKIIYMKAIAKTHPDKLPQDASTEVRLIAGLVFSTLNESWDKFKAENGL